MEMLLSLSESNKKRLRTLVTCDKCGTELEQVSSEMIYSTDKEKDRKRWPQFPVFAQMAYPVICPKCKKTGWWVIS